MHTAVSILLYSHIYLLKALQTNCKTTKFAFCATLPKTHFSLFLYKAKESPLSSSATLQQNTKCIFYEPVNDNI